MIKGKLYWTRGHIRCRIKGRNTSPAEAATLIARLCMTIEESCRDYTAEEVLEVARCGIDAMREEDERKVECYKAEDVCEHFGAGGWCDKYGMQCEEVPYGPKL